MNARNNERDTAARTRITAGYAFVREQPGVAITVGYLVLSLIGIMFSWALFDKFNVPFFQFADVTDFLLAVVREPVTFLLALGAIPVAVFLFRLTRHTQAFYAKHRRKSFIFRWLHRIDRTLGPTPLGFTFALATYAFLFITLYAAWKADRIKAGEGERVQVRATREAGPIVGEEITARLTLLGTTTQYVFLFDPEQQATHVVPAENIAAIEFNGPDEQSRQRSADAEDEAQGRAQQPAEPTETDNTGEAG